MRAAPYVLSTLMLSLATAAPAFAQDRSFNFALRGGIAGGPAYPGSDEYEASPDLAFTFGALRWGALDVGSGVGTIPEPGVAFRGALRVIGSRKAADYSELAGLEDIDTTVELGFGLIYRDINWEVFGEVRRGFGGHEGVTGTLGADLVFRPDDRWTITAGPRINFGDDDYASTYFGVTAAEAGASRFAAFNAEGGTLGAGVLVQASYQIDNNWALQGAVGYEKLLNDAADSPITRLGSDDQWTIRIGLSRAFTLNF